METPREDRREAMREGEKFQGKRFMKLEREKKFLEQLIGYVGKYSWNIFRGL